MPPMQHLFDVDVSGLKNNPYGLHAMFNSSRTTPGSTHAYRSSALISRIRFIYRLTSATMPLPTTCPAIDVPPARAMILIPLRRTSPIRATKSASSFGYATPYGISRYTLASVAYATLCKLSISISMIFSQSSRFFFSFFPPHPLSQPVQHYHPPLQIILGLPHLLPQQPVPSSAH